MSPKRIFTLVVLLLVLAVLIVAASRSPKAEPTAQKNPAVINNTKGLEVISAVRSGQETYFAFRNDYDKNVMAYVISCGDKVDQQRFQQDWAYSEFAEAGIPPHTVYEDRLSICGSIGKQSNNPLVIEAVVLEGGTGDGNPAVVQEVKDEHLGQRIQIERTLKLLDHYLNSTKSRRSTGVGDLKSQLLSALDSPEADNLAAFAELQPARQANILSEQVKSGLGTSKSAVLQRLREAENAQNPREAILRFKEDYERIRARL